MIRCCFYIFSSLILVLLFTACKDDTENQAAELYKYVNQYAERRQYTQAIEILQKIRIDYETSTYAGIAEQEIQQYQELF